MSESASAERIRIGDQYYLIAGARTSRRPKTVLSHEELFGLFDVSGDIPAGGREDLGLFFHGTRHLDRFELRVNGHFPHFLTSRVSDDNVELVTQLTNTDLLQGDEIAIPRDTIAIRRTKTLFHDRLYEVIELRSYHADPVRCDLLLTVHADFADIFELRGLHRSVRGLREPPMRTADGIVFRYHGTDGRARETVLRVTPSPESRVEPRAAVAPADRRAGPGTPRDGTTEGFLYGQVLAPGEELRLEISVTCTLAGVTPSPLHPFAAARAAHRDAEHAWLDRQTRIHSSNEFLNHWVGRSAADLAMLRSDADGDAYIYAGIPWFATMFGRDGVITALATLAFAPEVAAGTLRRLAALQGTEEDAPRDEQPGKIVHEVRDDEMAVAGEVPFGRYYGSVDSTPLFLLLASAYVRRTGDVEIATELWDHIERALHWIDGYGDRDGDGYVEYRRETPRGLANQGWKDSHDAIFHRDGRLAEPPIALVEVQGYVYAARRGLACVARRLGKSALARDLRAQAAELQRRFHHDFWMDDEGLYALALDAEKRRCEIVTSNPGHCLFTGIVPRAVAPRMAARMMQPDLFCGWGIRTLSARETRFNPMSYHNGSIWPHDNAIIAAGLRRYGAAEAALRVLGALFDASQFTEHSRLPELFCGFEREAYGIPVPYPVACRPQAWAAACPFLLLQAVLGLTFDPPNQRVVFNRPILPEWLKWIVLRNLRLGNATVDVQLAGPRRGSAVEVLRREGDLEVLVRK